MKDVHLNFPSISELYLKYVHEKDQCRKCELYNCYNQVVQSEGCTTSPIFMIIGESPGQEESEQNRPFIGRAGQRLRKELKKYRETFNKSTTIISNVLGCRPQNNKFPDSAHTTIVETCVNSWLYHEINLLKPKIIITLGSHALWYVMGDKGVTEYRGNWKFLNRFRAWSMATFHPSYIIRQSYNPGHMHIEQQFENDIKSVVEQWKQLVLNDSRMSMTEDEWKKHKAIEIAISKGMMNEDNK